jgi:hypothetical protein
MVVQWVFVSDDLLAGRLIAASPYGRCVLPGLSHDRLKPERIQAFENCIVREGRDGRLTRHVYSP